MSADSLKVEKKPHTEKAIPGKAATCKESGCGGAGGRDRGIGYSIVAECTARRLSMLEAADRTGVGRDFRPLTGGGGGHFVTEGSLKIAKKPHTPGEAGSPL